MLSFKKSNSFKIAELREKDKSTSTLLVPAHLIDGLKLKKSEHGLKISAYLKNLLKLYKIFTHSGMIPPPRKIKTEFQDAGLDLKRISFRPNNDDWLELGELALAFGKSRCYVFTFLLELDLLGVLNTLYESGLDRAVPTKNGLLLKVSCSLRRISEDFARSYYVRV